jgi:hypothetical protein
VLTIVEENHGAADALRSMPFLAGLADSYGRATAYTGLAHPSLPNYLGLAGGSTFGIRDDAGPSDHPLRGPSVFDLAPRARTYAEGMKSSCQVQSTGRYAVRHNPWVYFADSRARCRADDVPAGTLGAGALHDDIAHGTLPTVGLLVPDLCNDAHDCSLATADRWLRGWVVEVQAGPDWRAGRLAVVVTFDEDEDGGSGPLLTVVVWPGLHRVLVTSPLSHLSWSRWMTDLVGASPLRQAMRAASLGRAFGLARQVRR